mmetsp:Transcript_26783/g.80680  ORF Transcript_26783/g.80680 Transcript_26783/m.80680 type:complete len:232 (+) Transcript_26783:659-1354(+)
MAAAAGSSAPGSSSSPNRAAHMHSAVSTPPLASPATAHCPQRSSQQNARPSDCAAPGRPSHCGPVSQPLASTTRPEAVLWVWACASTCSAQTHVAVRTEPLCDVDASHLAQPSLQQTVTPSDCAAPGRSAHASPWSQPWAYTVDGRTGFIGFIGSQCICDCAGMPMLSHCAPNPVHCELGPQRLSRPEQMELAPHVLLDPEHSELSPQWVPMPVQRASLPQVSPMLQHSCT